MKHVTIKDIARSLCISVSTVSRALTDDKNIRKETREMVNFKRRCHCRKYYRYRW